MIDVLVVGGKGKMGSLTAETVAAQDDLRLAAIVDPKVGGAESVPAYASVPEALTAGPYGAAVEFSLPASVFENTRALLAGRRADRGRRHRAQGRADRRAARRRRGERRRLHRRHQLRHRRRADDALRGAGGTLLRHGRDRRAARVEQEGRALGHGALHGASHGGRAGFARRPASRETRRRAVSTSRACASTACACPAWWPIRRSCSAAAPSCSRCATTRTPVPASWAGCCSRCARSPASRKRWSGWRTCLTERYWRARAGGRR